jgi:hypothetical protein
MNKPKSLMPAIRDAIIEDFKSIDWDKVGSVVLTGLKWLGLFLGGAIGLLAVLAYQIIVGFFKLLGMILVALNEESKKPVQPAPEAEEITFEYVPPSHPLKTTSGSDYFMQHLHQNKGMHKMTLSEIYEKETIRRRDEEIIREKTTKKCEIEFSGSSFYATHQLKEKGLLFKEIKDE